MNELSLRLSTIASLVPKGARVCDVGTDHGYLAIHLKSRGIAKKVIASDINIKPLENAAKNIEKSGVSGIELRLSDGLSKISPDEADTFIIAGMGGEVISEIIENGKEILSSNDVTLILQPTTSPEFLRKYLCFNGYEILNEIAISENSKLYTAMLVNYTGKVFDYKDFFYYVGKVSPKSESGFLYLKKQFERCKKCADALRVVETKKEDYLFYSKISKDISKYIKGEV